MDNQKITRIKETSDNMFESDVLKATGLVLVDFWAPWCGPCLALAPKLEEIAAESSDQFVKINTDDNRAAAGQIGVRGLPTLVLFKNGMEVGRLVGNHPKDTITALIEKHR